MIKKIYFTLTLLVFALCISAQQNQSDRKFSPEKFDADLQAFITQEAHLTPAEAEKFFPVYKEMQSKQRGIFVRLREICKQKPQDEKGCKKAIIERDELELEMKRILQTYHTKFFDILPATKVYDIITAEDKFHRKMIKGFRHDGHSNENHKKEVPKPKPKS